MSDSVKIGNIEIGTGHPIAVQSMCNVNPHDERALLRQISSLTDAGCDIVRLTVPDMEAAEVFGSVKRKLMTSGNRVPLVADIHFDYRLAIASIEQGADKIRINPGNIGGREKVALVVRAARERNVPIRVGVNSGSLERSIIEKYGGVTAEGLAESALLSLKLIEELNYGNLVVSIKSSDVRMNYQAHKLLASKTNHPIHIGITEAGTVKRGKIKSAVGIGGLLLEGIGDTMRVSLTGDPVEEVYFAHEILRSMDMMQSAINLVSCPTCGRTRINLEELTDMIERELAPIETELSLKGKPSIKVAVMGCAVNGPGEAREADFGVAGGKGEGLLFKKGEILKKVPEKDIVRELIALIRSEI